MTVLLHVYPWRARHSYRDHQIEVRLLGGGVGEIDCIECGGDGDWGKFLAPEQLEAVNPEGGTYACVQCKGTGRQLITVCPSLAAE